MFNKEFISEEYKNRKSKLPLTLKVVPVVVVGGIALSACTVNIKQGHVGAVYDRFKKGIQSYTLDEGLNFIAPWQKVNQFPISTEVVYMSADSREGSKEDESIDINCSDGVVNADLSYTYHFSEEDVPKVQRKYRGKDGEKIMQTLRGTMRGWISEVTKNYDTMQVHLTNKEEINGKLVDHLNKKAKSYGVVFENITIMETRPSEKVKASIEERQQISQEVEKQKLNLEKAEIAKREAELEAERKVIEAEGERKANEIKAQGLDQRILKQMAIEAWEKGGSQVPQAVGSGTITNLK